MKKNKFNAKAVDTKFNRNKDCGNTVVNSRNGEGMY